MLTITSINFHTRAVKPGGGGGPWTADRMGVSAGLVTLTCRVEGDTWKQQQQPAQLLPNYYKISVWCCVVLCRLVSCGVDVIYLTGLMLAGPATLALR